MTPQRLIPAAILGPLLILATYYFNAWGYAAALTAFAGVGSWEFFQMLRRAGYAPAWGIAIPLSVLLAVSPLLPPGAPFHLLVLSSVAALGWAAFGQRGERSLLDWALGVGVALYVGGLLAYFLLLRGLPSGDHWVRVVLLCTWAADTAAFVVGRRWGRLKLAPVLSPNKSVEGAIAGIVTAALVSAAIGLLWPVERLPLLALLALGLAIGLAGLAGDLLESFIKRQLGAKDSSHLLAGHGGLLDRLDSLLAAGMVAYYYLWALNG